jgi:hypothetical protein
MSNYVIRRKVFDFAPTPIPKTNYAPPSPSSFIPPPPIPTTEAFARLSIPKRDESVEPVLPPIPHYEAPALEFTPIDVHVNAATLERDVYLKHSLERREQATKAEEPTAFLAWQSKMNAQDDVERIELIQKRHRDLDFVSRRAKNAKKHRIEEHLAIGREVREQFADNLAVVEKERIEERAAVQQFKRDHPDLAPSAI